MTKAKLLITCLLGALASFSHGQQNEELIRIECDTSTWSVTNFPPQLNMTREELSRIMTQETGSISQDTGTLEIIWVCAMVRCDGSADYLCTAKAGNSPDTLLCGRIVELLKRNCTWTPGKVNKDSYENVLIKKGNKSAYTKRKVVEYVHYQYCMKFERRNGLITVSK